MTIRLSDLTPDQRRGIKMAQQHQAEIQERFGGGHDLIRGSRVRGRGVKRDPATGMNRTEKAYSEHLEVRRVAGDIIRWDFQPERMRLSHSVLTTAPGTLTGRKQGNKPAFYTPDFRVHARDGVIEFHEVKGHWQEAAKVRIRVAADLHPYRFFVVQANPRAARPQLGTWSIQEVR